MSGRTQVRVCPERTCVGCRERLAKGDLLRVVLVTGQCVPDQRGTLPGRGAYVHPTLVCLELAVRRRAFPRAFRGRGQSFGTAELRRYIERLAERSEQAPP